MRHKKVDSEIENEIINYSLQHLNYSGEVVLSIVNDKKIILKKIFHNAGKDNLFKFIANCLAGNFGTAKTLQPVKIKLFYNDWTIASAGETEIEMAQNNIDKWKNIEARSNFIYYNTSGNVEKVVSENDEDISSYKAILHFRVPFSYVKHNLITEHPDKVNQICIYADGVSNDDNFSASFLITKTVDNEEKMSEIELKKEDDNYTLIVDWAMMIDNQK